MLFITIEILFFNGYYNSTVCKRIISFGRRPAIHHKLIWISGSRSNDTTGTHAKRENTFSINLVNQAIRRWWKKFIPNQAMILNRIDQRLGMLNPNSQSKWFDFNFNFLVMQH